MTHLGRVQVEGELNVGTDLEASEIGIHLNSTAPCVTVVCTWRMAMMIEKYEGKFGFYGEVKTTRRRDLKSAVSAKLMLDFELSRDVSEDGRLRNYQSGCLDL